MLLHLLIYYKYLLCTDYVLGTVLYTGGIRVARKFSWSSHSSDHFSKYFIGLNPLNSHKYLCGKCYNPHFFYFLKKPKYII